MKFTMRILATAVAAALAGTQAAGAQSVHPVSQWGAYAAAAFDWSIPSPSTTTAPGVYTFDVPRQFTVPEGPTIAVWTTQTAVQIGSGTNAEISRPTAVQCGTSLCSVTLSLSLAHPSVFEFSSASAGLQEAINQFGGGGGTVVLTSAWQGSIPSLLQATGTAAVGIVDERGPVWQWYGWNGTNYQAAAPADVRALGARCDGATDDRSALQSALALVAQLRVPLQLPAGMVCVSSGPLTFSSGTRIVSSGNRSGGGGVLSFRFTPAASGETDLLAPAPGDSAAALAIAGVVVDYRGVVAAAGANVVAIKLAGGEDATVRGCAFEGPVTNSGEWSGGVVQGLQVVPQQAPASRADYVAVLGNEFSGDTQDVAVLGTDAENSVNAGVIADNIFFSVAPANQPKVDGIVVGGNVRLVYSNGERISGNRFANPGNNISVEAGGGGHMVVGNYFDSSSIPVWVAVDPVLGAAAVLLGENRGLTSAHLGVAAANLWMGVASDGSAHVQDLSLLIPAAATATSNHSGPILHLTAQIWHQSMSTTDDCQLQNLPLVAGGADPNMSLTLHCQGSAGRHELDLSGLDEVQLPALQQPVLVGPSIGGETFSASPRSFLSAYAAGPLSTPAMLLQVTLDKAMTLTRLQAVAATAPVGCATAAQLRIYPDGDPSGGAALSIAGATNDSGALAVAFASGTVVDIAVTVGAAGCSTAPSNLNVVAQWRTN